MGEKNRLIRLSDSDGVYVCPISKSDGVFMPDGNTTLTQSMAGKVNFKVDNTSNIEIPEVDEKLDIVSKKYDEVSGKLDNVNTQISGVNSQLEHIMQDKVYLSNYKRLNNELNDDGVFTRALNDLNHNGTLIVPSANYEISTINIIKRKIKIIGEGHIGQNHLDAEGNNYIKVTGRGFVYNENNINLDHSGITFENLNILGSENANSGISILKTSGLYLNRVKFSQFTKLGSNALLIDGQGKIGQYGIVDNCNFYNNECSIYIKDYNGLKINNIYIEGYNYFNDYETFDYSRLRNYGIVQESGDTTVITNPVIQFVQIGIDIRTQQENINIIAPRLEAVKIGIKNNALETKVIGGFFNNYITGVSSSDTYAIDNIRANSNLSVIGLDNATGNLLKTVDNRVLCLCKNLFLLADNTTIKLNDCLIKWLSTGKIKIEESLNVKRHLTIADGSSDGKLYFTDTNTGLYEDSNGILKSIGGFNPSKLLIDEVISSSGIGVGARCFPVYRSNGTLAGYVPIYDQN